MSLFNRFWQTLKSPGPMAAVAIVGIAFSVYQTFYFERRGEFVVSIDSVTPVFDVHRPVGGLQISYHGQDLRSAKKTLWAMSFTLKNAGNSEIRKGDFDDAVPFGVRIDKGEVVDKPAVTTSNNYLRQHAQPRITGNTITIAPAIFEPGDTVQIDALLLSSDTVRPSLSAIGKIAGMTAIKVLPLESKEEARPFIYRVFDTDELGVHLVRTALYGAFLISIPYLLIFTIIGGMYPHQVAERFRDRKKARVILSHFKPTALTNEILGARQLFAAHGLRGLHALSGAIHRLWSECEKLKDQKSNMSDPEVWEHLINRESGQRLDILKTLKKEGLIRISDGNPVISKAFLLAAKELVEISGSTLGASFTKIAERGSVDGISPSH